MSHDLPSGVEQMLALAGAGALKERAGHWELNYQGERTDVPANADFDVWKERLQHVIDKFRGNSFVVLEGKTIQAIDKYDAEIVFHCDDGTSYKQYHLQDCCESVYVEDVVGDLADVIGSPILKAEESSSSSDGSRQDELYTWTFYKLDTIKGGVTIRWYGSSNGYYSESVSFTKVD